MNLDPVTLGAVIAAVITGVLSLLGLIISKEQKTSEFRQQWIESLRSDISMLLSRVEVVMLHVRAIKQDASHQSGITNKLSNAAIFDTVTEDIREAERCYHQVLLRINPVEHKKISDILEEMRQKFTSGNIPSSEELHKIEQQLISNTQTILKAEWERVKKGEPTFKMAKYISATLILLALIIALYSSISTIK